MTNFFGGGFTAPPGSKCTLRQAPGPFQQQPVMPLNAGPIPASFPQQQFTQPMHQLGVSAPAPAPLPQYQPRAHVLPVVELGQQQMEPAPQPERQYVQTPGPMGPRSYPVMKKGEAPCPICRG